LHEAVAGEVFVNKIPLIASLVGALGAAVGGYFLIPGEGEQLAMLMRDGHDELALEKADGLFARGVREPTLLMQAFLLNQRAGEYGQASEILDAYFKQRPDDANAWRKVAEVFAASGQSELYRNALENVVRLTRDALAAGKLAAIYRLRADGGNELRVLSTPDAASLDEADAIRLAVLLQEHGKPAEATSVLEAFDEKDPGLSDQGRIQLFTAMIDEEQFAKAVDRALAWQKGKEPSPLQDVFVRYLLRAGADSQALRLAGGQESTKNAGSIAHLAQLLSDEGRYDLVEQLVDRSLAYAQKLPVEKLDTYLAGVVNIALAKGTGDRLLGELYKAMSRHGSPEVEASFVQAVFNQMGYVGIAPFRSEIGPRVLLIRPVFAARLFTVEHNALAARRFLMATDLFAQSATARFEWLALAQQTLAPEELGSELARRARLGAIPPEMKRAVLEVMLREASQPQTMAVWHAFFGSGEPDFQTRRVAQAELARGFRTRPQ
jgi:hypothetical protein